MPHLHTLALALAALLAGCGAIQVVEVCPAERPPPEAPAPPAPSLATDLPQQ